MSLREKIEREKERGIYIEIIMEDVERETEVYNRRWRERVRTAENEQNRGEIKQIFDFTNTYIK